MKFSINIKQHDASDCGVAALASVAAYHGLKIALAKLRIYSGTGQGGTTIQGIIEAANKFGLEAQGFRGKPSSLYKVPKPVILHLKKADGLLHFVVLYKISGIELHIMDPYHGRITKVRTEDLIKEWTGYLIIVEPGNSFKKGRDGASTTTRLIGLIMRDFRQYAKVLVCSLFYILIALSTSIFIKFIIDDIIPNHKTAVFTSAAFAMLILTMVSFVLSVYRSRILLKLSVNTDKKIIYSYLEHVFRLPLSFFELRKAGEITSRVGDAFKIRALLSNVTIDLSIGILSVIVSFFLLFTIFWKLSFVVLFFIPVYLFIYWIYDKINKKVYRQIMEYSAQFDSQLIESIKSVRTVKHFGIETYTIRNISEKLDKLCDSILGAGKWGISISNMAESNSRLLSLAVLWIGGTFVLSSQITVGELFSFYTVTALFSAPLTSLIGINSSVREGMTAAGRIFEIMDIEKDNYCEGVVNSTGSCMILKMDEVSFRYPGREQLLEGFSMEMRSSEITALYGESGSGKSTIASLLLRMRKPGNGIISLDGINIFHINLELWRQWVAIVPQNMDLFGGTLIENIAPGDPEPDYMHVIELCANLNLLEFIKRLPNGFETSIGEGGSELSRGQQQRIAIARALYRNPKILIMDEATSSLDKESEEIIEKVIIGEKSKGTMILMISHKDRDIGLADKVIKL